MKRFIQSFFCITLLSLGALVHAKNEDCSGSALQTVASPIRPIIIPRNQGANTARELVGWQDYIHLCDVCETYGALAVEFEYVRSFRPARIARQLFGVGETTTGTTSCDSGSDETFLLRFQGSNVSDRSATSLLADYFGLSQNFDGTLKIRPRIDNFIVDFNFYLGLDCWVPHLYFRSHLPITHTRWELFDLNDGDCPTGGATSGAEIINSGSQNTAFPPCYMATGTATPASNILTALDGNFTFGDMQTEWKFGRFSRKRLDVTRLADIDLILGYDFLCDSDCYHLGVYLQAVAPTGNSPDAKFIFEPIAGNGGHWGLGGGVSAHSVIWENDCDQNLSVWLEGNVIHYFNNTQVRSFDLKSQGPLSRYMLLKEFDSDGAYTGRLINAINFTTRTVETKFDVGGDASLKFAYRNCGFMADIGYNIWGRDNECVKLCDNPTGQQTGDTRNNAFGIKGCEGVCSNNFLAVSSGTADNRLRGDAANPATSPLNSTRNNANAFSCGTTVDNGQFITPSPVPVADPGMPATFTRLTWDGTPQMATDLVTTNPNNLPDDVAACDNCPASDNVIFAQQSIINGTLSPATLTQNDINFLGVRSSLTHKVFGFVGYSWCDCDFTPFIGIHGEVEFDSRRNGDDDRVQTPTTDTTTNRRGDRSINQWGIGIKGGISF